MVCMPLKKKGLYCVVSVVLVLFLRDLNGLVCCPDAGERRSVGVE